MASAEAWAMLTEFRREWVGRKSEPRDEDWAELIDAALTVSWETDWDEANESEETVA